MKGTVGTTYSTIISKGNVGDKSRILDKEPKRESNKGGAKAGTQLGSVEERRWKIIDIILFSPPISFKKFFVVK